MKDPTTDYLSYNCLLSGDIAGDCSSYDIPPVVGWTPKGIGKFGQLDLSGSMWEWALDWFAPLPITCNNCANTSGSIFRVARGGGWLSPAGRTGADYRLSTDAKERAAQYGFRCAR
jgi:formylglycine-generating enzyme required for sulfatase activity